MIPSRRSLAAVFLAALVLRGWLWWRMLPNPRLYERPDTSDYAALGRNLARHGVFSTSPAPPWRPESARTPGYPLWLAFHDLVSPGSPWPALSQVFLDSGTAVLVALSAASLAPASPAWIAGLFYALDPVAAAHAPLLLSETLFTFLLAAALYALLLSGRRARLGPALASGFFLGLATLTRPVSLYLWIPWGAALAWAWGRGRRRAAAAWAAAAVLLPCLWCLRNLAVFGHFSYSTISGVNILFYEAAAVRASQEGLALDEARRLFSSEVAASGADPADPFRLCGLRWEHACRYLRRHPGAALRAHAVWGAKMLLGPGLDLLAQELEPATSLPAPDDRVPGGLGGGTRALVRRSPWLWAPLAYTLALLALTYLLAAAGLRFWLERGGRFFAAACLAPAACLLAVSVGGWAYYRFRAPLWPFVCVLAAGGWLRLRGGRTSGP